MIVVANGMLRSGSTLQYNLAASALETAVPLSRVGFLGNCERADIRAKLERMKADKNWFIFKTHDFPLEPEFYDERVHVLFSYRDIRDTAASIRKKWGYPFEQILTVIQEMVELEKAFTALPNVLFQPYGQLYSDLRGSIRAITRFLGIDITEENTASIADRNTITAFLENRPLSTFNQMLQSVFTRQKYDRHTLLHRDHVSITAGRDGDWRNQLSLSEIAVLEEYFGPWLEAHGYK